MLASYGLALIVLAIVIVIVFEIIARPNTQQPSCTAPPGFTCSFLLLNRTGVLVAKFSQSLGTQLIINGVACADQQNYTGDTPLYGNVNVNSLNIFYPSSQGLYPPGNSMYSGSYYIFYLYCYKNGNIASGSLGTPYSGYVWLNYTIPNYGYQVQKIATFTAEYS